MSRSNLVPGLVGIFFQSAANCYIRVALDLVASQIKLHSPPKLRLMPPQRCDCWG